MNDDNDNHAYLVVKGLISAGLVGMGFLSGEAAPLLMASLAGGVGSNWLSSLSEHVFDRHAQRWFSADGVLNHDLAKALERAFARAVESLQRDWPKTDAYQELTGAEQTVTRKALKRFATEAPSIFEQMVRGEAKAQQQAQLLQMVQQRASGQTPAPALLTGMFNAVTAQDAPDWPESFHAFLRAHLVARWHLQFGEALKQDHKALIAYERIWQTSVSDGLATLGTTLSGMQGQQSQIQRDVVGLRVLVEGMREQLTQHQGGTPLLAPDAVISVFEQQVRPYLEAIRADLRVIQATVEEIQTVVTDTQAGVATIQTGVDATNAGLEAIQADIEVQLGLQRRMLRALDDVQRALAALARRHAEAGVPTGNTAFDEFFIDTPGLYPPCPQRIGQEDISRDLHTRLERALNERIPAVVVLESPPGYGKRAMVRECAEACVAHQGVVLATDFSFPPAGDDPEQLGTEDAPDALRDQLAQFWPKGAMAGQHWLHLMAQIQVAWKRALTPGRLGVNDDPEAVISVVRSLAYGRPVMLVLEHWERATLVWDTLLSALVKAITGNPMRLVIVVTRDLVAGHDDQATSALHQAIANGTVVQHRLRRVDDDDLAASLGRMNLNLSTRLQTLSGGHPALALALWDEWEGTGFVECDERGVWQATDADSPWVAGSMRDLALRLLNIRLAQDTPLPIDTVRQVLAIAALEGPSFTAQAVADAAGVDPDQFLDVCDLLVEDTGDEGQILIEEGAVPQLEEHLHLRLDRYSFALPYLHLVFTTMLLAPDREATAFRLAIALEQRYQPEPARVAEALAALLKLGGDATRAEAYRLRYERDQAEQTTEQALRWTLDALMWQGLQGMGLMYEAHTKLGNWMFGRSRFTDAVVSFREALRIAEELADHLRIAHACGNLSFLLQAMGDLAGARPYLERALAIHEQALGPAHPTTATSFNNLGTVLRAQGDLANAATVLRAGTGD